MQFKTRKNEQQAIFSVIIATYNRAHMISQAIRSVLAQTYHDFEILVVDDASPDETPQVVASFNDPRIVNIRREQNGGVGAATNTAIRRAKGKYVCFLGDDDEYLPEFLAETYRKFETLPERIGFTGCGIRVIGDCSGQETFLRNQIPAKPQSSNREENYLSCLKQLPFGTGWGMTLRPTCFELIGLFDETLRTDVDRDFILRLVRHFDYDVIEKVLVKVYRHSGPKVTTYGLTKAQSYEKLIKKNFTALSSHPRLWTDWHYKTGWLYYHSGEAKLGRKFMLTGLRRYPYHLKSWLGLILFEAFGPKGPDVHQYMARTLYKITRKSQNALHDKGR